VRGRVRGERRREGREEKEWVKLGRGIACFSECKKCSYLGCIGCFWKAKKEHG
jgi:hypothetical protein